MQGGIGAAMRNVQVLTVVAIENMHDLKRDGRPKFPFHSVC